MAGDLDYLDSDLSDAAVPEMSVLWYLLLRRQYPTRRIDPNLQL